MENYRRHVFPRLARVSFCNYNASTAPQTDDLEILQDADLVTSFF